LGELGQSINLSAASSVLRERVLLCFESQSEETKTAAAYALGRVAVGNMKEHLPALLFSLPQSNHQYLLLADYSSYIAAQERVDALYRTPEAWARKALRNIAGMGPFSSDRTIAEYARDIWRVPPMALPS
jgi:glucan phosphorylase